RGGGGSGAGEGRELLAPVPLLALQGRPGARGRGGEPRGALHTARADSERLPRDDALGPPRIGRQRATPHLREVRDRARGHHSPGRAPPLRRAQAFRSYALDPRLAEGAPEELGNLLRRASCLASAAAAR